MSRKRALSISLGGSERKRLIPVSGDSESIEVEPQSAPDQLIYGSQADRSIPPSISVHSAITITPQIQLCPSKSQETRTTGLCFRIRAVPLRWTSDTLLQILGSLDQDLGHQQIELTLCQNGLTQTAVLSFEGTCTAFFRKIPLYEDFPIMLKNKTFGKSSTGLIIDRHFHGLTVLHEPTDWVEKEYDCSVFILGFGA